MKPKLKIVVCHHKETPLLSLYQQKSEWFIHVHGGRAIAKNPPKFLLDMQSDDVGDCSLSQLNYNCNEYSVMHWAWKNYEMLGDPEYIGLFHYRRAFTESQVLEALQHEIAFFEDITSIVNQQSLLTQFCRWHTDLLPGVKELLDSLSSPQKEIFQEFMTEKAFYPKNMFIMKKEYFFWMMEQLDAAFQQMLKLKTLLNFSRGTSFTIERLTSLAFSKLMKDGHDCIQIPIPKNYI